MKDSSNPIVHIVHHIDTEGPLCEPIEEVFKRVENTYGIKLDIPWNQESLKRLQSGELDGLDSGVKKGIITMLDPHLINFKTSWHEVDEMLNRMLTAEYRESFQDSFSNGWVYNWHILDHVGFETNERGRDMGYLNIFNHYERLLRDTNSDLDELHWHFHPIPFYKEAHIPATSYENSYPVLHQVLSRRLIDKRWFPRVNRAGFHTIRPDSNFFLEQWIPFDASNQSMDHNGEIQKDAINGRFGDWTGAPSDWSVYHPDLYDWRRKGNLNRVISRCLNLKTRFRNIDEKEIEKAFKNASETGNNVYLGVTNHDFREMSDEIEYFYGILKKVASNFSNVHYKFSGAIEAFRSVLGFSSREVKEEAIKIDLQLTGNVLSIKVVNGGLFGSQPYLALKTLENKYYHDNFDFGDSGKDYYYTFDRYTIDLEKIKTIAVAANDKYGNSHIVHGNFDEKKLSIKNYHNI